MVGLRLPEEIAETLADLQQQNPLISISAFASEALKRGVPSVVQEYSKKKEKTAAR